MQFLSVLGPQGSVLGSLLFNIYLNDLKNLDIFSLADDATPFICDKCIENVLKSLEENVEFAIDFFIFNNY